MRKKRLFYVSHPYGGKPENEKAVQAVIEELKEKHIPIRTDFPTMYYSNVEFVSPIQLLGPLYDAMPYLEGLNLCLSLLKRCDTIIMCGDWQNSRGCMAEYSYALAKHIPIISQEDLEW